MKNKLKNLLSIEFIIPNVFVPLLLLAAYCGIFAKLLLLKHQLVGVNYNFVFRLQQLSFYGFIPVSILYIPLFIFKKIRKGKEFSFQHYKKELFFRDLIILLLPLTPVVQYIINNFEILSVVDALYIMTFFVVLTFLAIFAIPHLFAIVSNIRIIRALGSAFVFTLIIMPSISSKFNWFWEGNFYIQVLGFTTTFIFIYIFLGSKTKKLLYLFIIINFLVSISFQLIHQNVDHDLSDQMENFEENDLFSMINGKEPEITPNIFFLVYEAYVPNETMLGYGIDNKAQKEYLISQGFELYSDVYSIGSPTVNSLSRVFNASTEYYGNQRRGISGDGVVQQIFKDLGYETYGFVAFTWIFRGYGSKYDYYFPETKDHNLTSYELLIAAILTGEFRSDLIFDEIEYLEYYEMKQNILGNDEIDKSFLYFHSGLPGHSQDSGACLANEKELYAGRLETANIEMQNDIEAVMKNHPDALIIVAGDHGPYLTKNCAGTSGDYAMSEISRLDIQDRFATFLAIRWPTDDYEKFDDIVVLQDLFPAVFSYMFKDVKILESRVEPNLADTFQISGITVRNGVIFGGIDHGDPLFINGK